MILSFRKLPAKTESVGQVILNDENISYKIIRTKRKTLAIHINPDLSITAKAPLRLSEKKIHAFIIEKTNWVIKTRDRIKSNPPKNREKKYENGEIFQYLGHKYKLKIIQCLANKIILEDKIDKILIVKSTHPKNKKKIKAQILDWHKNEAERVFNERLPICLDIAKKIDVNFDGEIKLRNMKARWGSCSSDGKITLNIKLIEHNIECIDYVILHELCHLREMNHSKKFYALMDIVMPEWKLVRKKLNK